MELQKLTISDITDQGYGISGFEGKKVFIDGTLPGEIVMAEIIEEHPTYFTARLKQIVKPSPDRRECICQVTGCGGCQLLHCSYAGQLNLKNNRLKQALRHRSVLQEVGHLAECVGSDVQEHYRNKSIYYVRQVNSRNIIGLFCKNSHRIIPVEQCLMDQNWISEANQIVLEWMNSYGISAFDEVCHKGLIREIIYRTGYLTDQRMIILVVSDLTIPFQTALLNMLDKLNITSLYLNTNHSRGNGIYGEEFLLISGKECIETHLGKLKFQIGPRAFWQINSRQCEKLYTAISEFAALTGKETVFDLYCGAGAISLWLASEAKKVYGVEIVDEAVQNARRNAEFNQIDNVEFTSGSSETIYSDLVRSRGIPDVVVVDPPRKGCDISLLRSLISQRPEKVIYVSCLPASLARDLQIMMHNGYAVENIIILDMFPQTMHVETVVLLSREK